MPRADPGQLPPTPRDASAVRWIFPVGGDARQRRAPHRCIDHRASASYVDAIGLGDNERHAINFPIAHIGGLVVQCCSFLRVREHLCQRLDPRTVIDVLAREHVTMREAHRSSISPTG